MRTFSLVALSLLVSLKSFAGDPLIRSYQDARLITGAAKGLVSSEMINGIYQDDDGNNRIDKVYYVIEYDFNSSFKRSDIDVILNPASGHISQLFSDPMAMSKISNTRYSIATSLSLVLMSLKINGIMDYSVSKGENVSIHNYFTHDYTKFLYQMRIRAEVSDDGSVHIVEVAAVKGSSQEKLNRIPTGNSSFKKHILSNVKKFSKGIGER